METENTAPETESASVETAAPEPGRNDCSPGTSS